MKDCTLIVRDECNIKFEGLDPDTRRKLTQSVEFFIPSAKYSPAYKLGRWSGKISFCDIGSRSYLNLLDILVPIVQTSGYLITLDDRRTPHTFEFAQIDETSYTHVTWPIGHPIAGQPIIPKEHQINIVNSLLTSTQGVTIASTGSGKTLCTAILSDKVEKYGRSIVIVPSKDLVTQTEADYINMGLDVGVYFGDRKDWGKKHTICTWQSLAVLNKMKDSSIEEFLDGVICVICDETHKCKSDQLKLLMTGPLAHVPIRWGMTGTLPEQKHEQMTLKLCIGDVLGEVKAKDLQDKGILANVHIHVCQLQDYIVTFNDYQAELQWLTTNKERLQNIANMIIDVEDAGNTMVLVDRIQAGKILEDMIPGSVFVSGSTKSKDRKKEYDEIDFNTNKIVIATFGIASTGLNIPSINSLFLIEPGKSFVRVIQSIGRSLRIAKGKNFANVYDICSSSKFSKRHLTQRKKFYTSAEYPFTIKKVQYLK